VTDLPEVKLKAMVNFPASATGRTGITVVKTAPNYFLDLDYTGFQITPTVSVGDMPNSYNLIWDEVKHTFAKVPFSLQATSGVSSLGAQTGAIVLENTLLMTGSTLGLNQTKRVITAAGDVTVAATDSLIILKKTVAAVTNFILPAETTKIGPVKIVDWNSVGGSFNLIVTPNGAETINGQATWQIFGGSVVLTPIGTGLGYAA
jgi:hypothetical protein